MQLRSLLLLGLTSAAVALPSSTPQGEHTPALAGRAPTKWEAAGGCKTDWGGRCLDTCKAEAKKKGVTCPLGSNIWKSDCWLGWSVCTCYCKQT